MEDWLEARVSSSRCCAACGESDCRTVEIGDATFEVIPERLVIKAVLIAAADLIA